MKRLRFGTEAQREFSAAALYYEQQQSGLGARFVTAIEQVASSVERAPEAYPQINDAIRKARIPRFPYGLIFRERPETIEVIAVMHLHRRPGYWRHRTE